MNLSIEPDTIQGVLTIITAVGVTAGLVATAVTKVLGAVREATSELKGIRTDQAAGDLLKVRQGQAMASATPGADPVTTADVFRGTSDGAVREAAVSLLERATLAGGAPLAAPATSEDLGVKMDRLAAILERMLPPVVTQ